MMLLGTRVPNVRYQNALQAWISAAGSFWWESRPGEIERVNGSSLALALASVTF